MLPGLITEFKVKIGQNTCYVLIIIPVGWKLFSPGFCRKRVA